MKMRLLLLAAISLLVFGCDSPENSANNIKYAKDERTGLCFVYNRTYGYNPVFTNVPCSPEVEKLIEIGKIQDK